MIPNLQLNKKQINSLLNEHKVFSGGEAIICESDNPCTLYKFFYKNGKIATMEKNKVLKIKLLFDMQLEYMVKPTKLLSFNDEVIGYEMTTDYDFDTYKSYQLSNKELIDFLYKTKEILIYFQNKGVTYGDVDFRNILLNRNTMEILFCDIDNVKINDYPMDIIPSDLINFDLDGNVHAYMHNIMTLKAFNLDIYCSSNFAIKKSFKNNGLKIILSMHDKKSFNDEYLIDYIKKHK